MLELCFTLYHHIIYIHLNSFAQLRLKHPDYHPLVDRPCIFQSKGHYFVVVIPNRCKKSSFFPDLLELTVSDDIPKMHPKSSSEDGLQLCPLIDLSKVGGKGPLGKLYLNL